MDDHLLEAAAVVHVGVVGPANDHVRGQDLSAICSGRFVGAASSGGLLVNVELGVLVACR